jgi:protein TonB
MNGLARRVVEVVKGPIETKIIEEVKPPPPPPPENLPPPPKLPPPPPAYMPPPEIQIQNPPPAPAITVQTVPPPPAPPVTIAPPPSPEPAPAPAPVVAARPAIANIATCAPKSEDYPAPALRAEATGTTKIRFTIDATGKVAKVEVVKSAGASREHRMLDRVAVDKLSTCRFTPGIDENGKAVGGSFDVEYVWKIT